MARAACHTATAHRGHSVPQVPPTAPGTCADVCTVRGHEAMSGTIEITK